MPTFWFLRKDQAGNVISSEDMFSRLDRVQRRVAEELDSPFARPSVLDKLVADMGTCMRPIAKVLEVEALVKLPAFQVLMEVTELVKENAYLHHHGWAPVTVSVHKALKATTWAKISELAKTTANTDQHDLLEHYRRVQRMQQYDSDENTSGGRRRHLRRPVSEYRRAATEEYEDFHVWLHQIGEGSLYERWCVHRQFLYDGNCARFPPVKLGRNSLD